jgi:hypothetical protein
MGRAAFVRGSRPRFVAMGLLCLASLPAGANLAAGQPVRMGSTFDAKPVDGGTRRFPAAAYDSGNDVYVVTWGLGNVGVRFVTADGVALGSPTNLNTVTSGPPAIACAANVNMCLVAWIQEPTSIIGRLIRYNAGSVQMLTAPFAINANGKSKLTSAAPDVAYSPVASEFLVAWTEFDGTLGGPDVRAQRVSPNGTNVGAEFVVAGTTYWEGNPSMAYNSQQDEYLVGYYCEAPNGADSLCGQRVKPGTGALIGGRSLVYTSFVDIYPEITYNSQTNQYLVISWGATNPWMLHGWLADGNAQPLGSTPIPLAAQGGGDGIGLTYNPVSNTYLAVYQSQKNAEVWGVEAAPSGAPGLQAQVTSSGTTLASQPMAAGSTSQARFLADASNGYTKVMAQLVGHGSMTTSGGTTTCTTASPGTGWTCVNGSWVPPTTTTTTTCTTVQPGTDWTCVNGSWFPPGSTTTTTTSCTTVSPGTGWTCVNGSWIPPTTTTTGSCTTVQPGTNWTCVNGNWLPPTTTTTTSCTTVSPGTGWTCVNGSWLPPTTTTTTSSCTTVQPGTDWTCVNGSWFPPGSTTTTTTSSCTTVQPGTGWTCVNGSWFPPTTTTTTTSTCTTVKPGTNWTCVNGNWLPPS